MKNILLFSVIIFSSCEYRDKVDKSTRCKMILDQREAARYSNQQTIMLSTDSLYIRCGCDTVKQFVGIVQPSFKTIKI